MTLASAWDGSDWFKNVRKSPAARVEIGSEHYWGGWLEKGVAHYL
jgi:hypothetical protein